LHQTISLDPIKAKMDFATIVDEVVEQFTSKLGVEVKISIEIHQPERALMKLCNALLKRIVMF